MSGSRPRLPPEELASIAETEDLAALVRRLKALRPDDAADVLDLVPDERLRDLEPRQALEVAEDLADDDAADLVAELPEETQEFVLEGMSEGDTVERLLLYDPESAGGRMTTAVVTVGADLAVSGAVERLRAQEHVPETVLQVFVVEPDGRLAGILPLERLVLAAPGRPVREVMLSPAATVLPDVDQEEVARTMARYNLTAVPVVGASGTLLGQVTFDDVIDVVEAEQTEDLLRFGGVSATEELGAGWRESVRSRLPWLMVNLLTASLAAGVVYLFQSTIARVVALAVWMPVVAGMGGNAGTQALAVTVRRLALGQIPRARAWRVVGKEMLVGATTGLVNGSLVALAAGLVHASPLIGIVVVGAMVGNLVVAGFAGAFIPLVLEKLGVDPAVASSVFVTAFTDVCGFLLLLGLGSAVLL